MSLSWEGMVVPEEWDREFFMKIINNHARAIGQLVRAHDREVDAINTMNDKLSRTASVLWHVVQKVCPDEARVVIAEIAEELDMADRIDELFADFEAEDDDA